MQFVSSTLESPTFKWNISFGNKESALDKNNLLSHKVETLSRYFRLSSDGKKGMRKKAQKIHKERNGRECINKVEPEL